MKSADKNKEVDTEKGILTLEVDSEVISKVRTGEITHLIAQIDENNQNMILENIDGNLVLVIDEMPTTFHGCYLYNNGEFPYAIKDELDCILLKSVEEECFTRIISVDTEPGTRFKYQGVGEPIKEDPNGDSCIWEVYFEVVPVPEKSKTYLMCWNPSISSFTEKDYEECVNNMVHGMFRMNWSIYEWEEARRGDMFFMMRVGDDKAGIVFLGQFITDPYPGDDWAGSTKRRMYVEMVCMNPVEPGAKPRISLEKLQESIPTVDWSKGHSGVLLSEEVVTTLDILCEEEWQ